MDECDWRAGASREYQEKRSKLLGSIRDNQHKINRLHQKNAELEREVSALDHGARAFGLSLIEAELPLGEGGPSDPRQRSPEQQPPGQFKDAALRVLRQAFPSPLKAKEVQIACEHELARTFHWKTAGMTLNRFQTDGRVRREGHRWFWVPPATASHEETPMTE